MASIFDLVTSANVVAYWLEKNINEQAMLGESLFPYVREIGVKLEWIKGANDQPVGLRLSSYDAKAIRRDVQGIEEYTTKMPFFKESVYIDEDLRQQLNTVIQTNNKQLIYQILDKIFDREIKLIRAAQITLERMRIELLYAGTITLASNGQGYNYDFGIPEAQMLDVTDLTSDNKAWSNPKADIIAQINEIKDAAKAKGITLTRAICNSSVVNAFAKNENIKNQIYVLAGGSVSSVSSARALSYLEQETGIKFYSYDNVYVDEQGNAHKYYPDNTVTFIPDGALGNTHMGVTPEESDLMAGYEGASVRLVNNGVAVTTYGTADPVNVETKVSMVALPSFERANEVYVLDVEPTSN